MTESNNRQKSVDNDADQLRRLLPEPLPSLSQQWLPYVSGMLFLGGIACAYLWLCGYNRKKSSVGSHGVSTHQPALPALIDTRVQHLHKMLGYATVTLIGLAAILFMSAKVMQHKFSERHGIWLWQLPSVDRAAVLQRDGMIRAGTEISGGLTSIGGGLGAWGLNLGGVAQSALGAASQRR